MTTTTVPQPVFASVTLPVTQALDRVKLVLFRPFNPGKWFAIGFCAWLATLGQGGGGGYHFNFPSGGGKSGNLRHALEEATRFVHQNLAWLLPLLIVGVVLGLTLWVLITWLSSRGQFMFLHCVALDKAEVGVPWQRYAPQGNSLFWFRLGFGLLGAALTLPLVGFAVVLIASMIKREVVRAGPLLAVIGLLCAVLAVSLVWAVIRKFTLDFVTPIMAMRNCRCLAAWREFLGLARGHFWPLLLYLLFQLVLGLGIGLLVLAVVLLTCCLAGCLLAVPYLGTVILLPVLVFQRAYSLHYLAQYGPAYDVFTPPPATPGTAS